MDRIPFSLLPSTERVIHLCIISYFTVAEFPGKSTSNAMGRLTFTGSFCLALVIHTLQLFEINKQVGYHSSNISVQYDKADNLMTISLSHFSVMYWDTKMSTNY